jgi:type III restriction enzyme
MFRLRDYQEKAVVNLLDNVYALIAKSNHRTKLVFKAPTGSGKTVTMAAFLNTLAQDIQFQYNLRHRKLAYIWIAPNELHIQSYDKIKQFFEEIRTIRCIQFDDILENSLQENDLLFLNWQSISNEKNIFVRENEQSRNLYQFVENSRLNGIEIITILDEAHLFAAKGQKANNVLTGLNSLVEIDVSATPYFDSDYKVVVRRDEVVKSGMIKRGVILNTGFDTENHIGEQLDSALLYEALSQRKKLAETYQKLGLKINPLLLIQLPSESSKDTQFDFRIREFVIMSLQGLGIKTENNKLAIWLSNEKENLEGIEELNNLTEVLLFKQAIALGWDCPRASILLIYRDIKQETFTVQTVGRILRMPEHKHYSDDILNIGFVYTNLSRDIIRIVADDIDYLVQNKAVRKEEYTPLFLEGAHINFKQIRNRLDSKFKIYLNEVFEEEFGLSLEIISDEPISTRNCNLLTEKLINLEISNINIAIPSEVFIEGDDIGHVHLDRAKQIQFAKTMGEIMLIFKKFCLDNVGDFARVDSAPMLETALVEFFENYLDIDEYAAYKIILHESNRTRFEGIIKIALEKFTEYQKEKRKKSQKEVEKYSWDVPEFKIYDNKYIEIPSDKSIHEPLFLYKRGENLFAESNTEYSFMEYLERNKEYIEWWYKNGVGTKADFAVTYTNTNGEQSLFYVDFVIKFKSGVLGLFDTKTPGSDSEMVNKQKALYEYITDQNKNGKRMIGGIILPDDNVWRYPKGLILNSRDLSGWEIFFPGSLNYQTA